MYSTVTQNLRSLRKQPAFAAAAISVIAIGIALATTASSIVDALVFRQIPAYAPEQLIRVQSGIYGGTMSSLDARDIAEHLSIDTFSYTHERNIEFKFGRQSELITAAEFQGNVFGILGWDTVLGRPLNILDTRVGSEAATVLSHHFWKNDLGADPNIVGEILMMNGKPFKVVGVLSEGLDRIKRAQQPDLWIAYVHTFDQWKYENRNWQDQTLVGRLTGNATLSQINSELAQIETTLRTNYPDSSGNMRLTAVSEFEAATAESGDVANQSYIIIGVVSTLLFIASFNVGNMLLSNAYRRDREFAIRRSLGASPRHLISQLLGESLTISFVGGILGIALSLLLIRFASALNFSGNVEFLFDLRVLAIAIAVSLFTGIASGLVPAIHLSRSNANDALKRGAKGSSISKSNQVFVIGQIAFSCALLVCSVLFYLSLKASFSFEPRHQTEQLAYFQVYMQSLDASQRKEAALRLRSEIEDLPGISSAGISTLTPLRGSGSTYLMTERFKPDIEEDKCFSQCAFGSRGYLAALGIPILEGRDFHDEETNWPHRVAIINESMQRRFWPEGNALGQEFRPWGSEDDFPVRVIGVFKDYSTLPWVDPQPLFIVPEVSAQFTVTLRSEGNPRSIIRTIENKTLNGNQNFAAGKVQLYSDAQAQVFGDVESTLVVLSILALTGLVFSTTGIWYTTRQLVRQSRKDMAIRLAIGAQPGNLLRETVKRCMMLIANGVAIGAPLSFIVARGIQGTIRGVSYSNPFIYIGVTLVIMLIALIASYIPARSSLQLQPREVLNEM